MTRTEQLKQRIGANGHAPLGATKPEGEGKALAPADALARFLASPAATAQIAKALPRHLTADRLIRIATTELRKIPKLAQCSPASFLGSVIQCAQLGLEPGSALGHVYIIPFDRWEKKTGRWILAETVATVIIGYRGMLALARRSGEIESIDAWPVYQGDKFRCVLGLDATLEHEPDWENAGRTQPDRLRFVYAVAKLKGGGRQFAVMSRAEVEMIRDRVFAKNRVDIEKYDGPWKSDFEAMALKTVVRRLFKMLPVSIEHQVYETLHAANPNADALALGEQAAAMLGEGPADNEPLPGSDDGPTDVDFREGGPKSPQDAGGAQAQAEAAEEGTESLQTDFDAPALTLGQKIENRMRAAFEAKDAELLAVAADEIRELASETERASLGALYRGMCDQLQAQ